MATLYADSTGAILRFTQTPADELAYGSPPGAAFTLTFDPTTNAATVQALNTDWNSFAMPGGTLQRNGAAVTIAAPSATFVNATVIDQFLQALASGQFQGVRITLSQAHAAWVAVQAGTATSAQIQLMLVFLARFQAAAFREVLATGAV